MVKSQNKPPHLSPLWSPVLSVPLHHVGLPETIVLCMEQLYSNGNKSDYESKQMHGVKKCTSVFWSPFPKGASCVLRTAFTNLSICQKFRERRTSHDWVKQVMAKLVSAALVLDTPQRKRPPSFYFVTVSS